MKVKDLIKQLKKEDPEAEVIFQDHDMSEDESNGVVESVTEVESDVLSEKLGFDKFVALR